MLHQIANREKPRPKRPEILDCITKRINDLVDGAIDVDGKATLKFFGTVSCVTKLRLSLAPFFEPSIIVVLSGTKKLGHESVHEGGCLAIPAPTTFHMVNEPNPERGLYQALVIPFAADDIQFVRNVLIQQGDVLNLEAVSNDIVTYDFDVDTLQACDHYLKSGKTETSLRMQHRKREILLILAERDPRILSLEVGSKGWSQRLRILFGEDPAYTWTMDEVCQRLAVTESTLRRALRKENVNFREVLSEFRLSNALMAVLMSSAPIYQIAYDNGFQSVSRFTENFRKRFGATPSDVRSRLPVNG